MGQVHNQTGVEFLSLSQLANISDDRGATIMAQQAESTCPESIGWCSHQSVPEVKEPKPEDTSCNNANCLETKAACPSETLFNQKLHVDTKVGINYLSDPVNITMVCMNMSLIKSLSNTAVLIQYLLCGHPT